MEKPFVRQRHQPILGPEDLAFPVNAVFNPGVAEQDGEILLLLRVEAREGISHIRVARSTNGVDAWRIDEAFTLTAGLRTERFRAYDGEQMGGGRTVTYAERKLSGTSPKAITTSRSPTAPSRAAGPFSATMPEPGGPGMT